MSASIFGTDVAFDSVSASLSIAFDAAAEPPCLLFAMDGSQGDKTIGQSVVVPLSDADGLTAASLGYDSLDRTYTLTLKLDADVGGEPLRDRIVRSGIVGASFTSHARLSSLKIVLRPRPPGGSWDTDHPSFSLIACWDLDAQASQTSDDAGIAVAAAVEVCAGLSVVVPDHPDLGLPNFQVRLDLPALGLSTEWVPLSWFEWPNLQPLRMEGLLAWFAGLVGFDFGTLPDVTPPRLPEWNVDLPLAMDLPLGLGVIETHLHLRRLPGPGLVVDASAEGFYLTWQGRPATDPRGRAVLRYVEASDSYTAEIHLFEAQYPEKDAVAPWQPYGFSLPFDLLGLEAECWYLRLGLFLSNAAGGKARACFEALLEIGGLRITSRFTGDGSNGLYRTDLRLLLRDTTLISARLAPEAAGTFLSGAKPPAGENPFARWAGKRIPALSFADDLLAPPPASGVNEYGLIFHDGAFRSGERSFLLWRMNGRRLLKALAHDLLGREPAGGVRPDEDMTDFGLELATQAGGARQIRLDWRPASAGAVPAWPDHGAPDASEDICLSIAERKDIAFNVPFASKGTHLDGTFSDPLALDLPAVSLEVACPRTQSIVLRAEPDGSHSASHLLLFDGAAAMPPDQPVPPLARARIGFSLKQQPGDGSDARDVVETKPVDDEAAASEPFLTVALGRAQAGDLAVRTVGWRRGRAPRFLEVLPADAAPIRSLIPATLPTVTDEDPGCPGQAPVPLPPAALDFDTFQTPRFGMNGWRLSARIAATSALFKMFDDPGGSGQRVSFRIKEICIDDGDDRVVLLRTKLKFALGTGEDAFEASGAVTFQFDLRDLSLSIADGASLAFRLPVDHGDGPPVWTAEAPLPEQPTEYAYSEELPLLGLRMTALTRKAALKPGDDPETIDVLTLSIVGGRFVLALPADRSIVLRYTGLGQGSLNFWVTAFVLGPGGLDAEGNLISSTMRVKGLKAPFVLEQASLRFRASRLDYLSVSGSGVLPELLDSAPIRIALTFKQDASGRIDFDSLDAHLGDGDKPIVSRGTRFRFEIQELGLSYRRAPSGGERHFFFELTGSAQFAPEANEFTSGLLENLRTARLDFVRVPLTDEFAEHISLSIELKRPIAFDVFGVFRMEIRSIGFHPQFPRFKSPTAAIIIGGQVAFADTGDVVRAEIDLHAMYLGLPEPDAAVPQVYFDGLRVDISTAEGFRIGGRVDSYEGDTLDGFAGEGTVQIPGFPELSAAFSFVRVRESADKDWLRAWFIAIEAAKIGYPIGGALPIYLRQIGLGFGYRYTLPLVLAFEKYDKLPDLINAMLREIGKHQTLARIDSWKAETVGQRWTIALEAVLSLGSANSSPLDYDETAEKEIRTVFTQILAVYRSDFTLVAAAKLWFPVSVDDFFRNAERMRERPLATGFFAFSAPQNRLLAHVRKNQDPYLGDDRNKPIPYPLKLALDKSYFEATLLIEPGLVHAELGWPDRLSFDLTVGPMRVGCRGGILMRIERELLIYGYYFSAYGELDLGGGVDFGFVGVRVEAQVRVQYATRLLIGANLRKPLASNIYGAIGLDIAVRFLVRAWLRLNFRFFKISIDIRFSFSLQISVLGEIGWAGDGDLGFRGRAQFVIGVFGRSLALNVDVGVNKGAVEQARNALAGYAGSFLEPGKPPPPMPGLEGGLRTRAASGFEARAVPAAEALLGLIPGSRSDVEVLLEAEPSSEAAPAEAEKLPEDAFVTAHAEGENRAGDDRLFFVWIMPGPSGERYYPTAKDEVVAGTWQAYATLELPEVLRGRSTIYVAEEGAWAELPAGAAAMLRMNPSAEIPLEAEGGGSAAPLTLDKLLAGCYVPSLSGTSGDEAEDFPRNWPVWRPDLTTPAGPPTSERRQDPRVFDAASPARGPRRVLDEGNVFDRAVLASAASAEKAGLDGANGSKSDAYLNEQALANQSLMLQGFYDDLTRIARTTRFDGTLDLPVTPSLGTGRPTLFDLGLLLCVKAKELPGWLAKRDPDGAYPSLVMDWPRSRVERHVLKPAADAACIDFALNPPVVRDAASYFDEETVALAWRLDWGGKAPETGRELAVGAVAEIEHFLRAYEIRLVDFDTQRVMRTVTTKPCEVLSQEEGKQVRLARYSYSVSRDEILSAGTVAGGRRLVATVTPISQAGTRGAPFSFTLNLNPMMTPLPADDARLELRHGTAWNAVMSWRQPILPQAVGIARTVGWQLILRPLAEVPLGAYPEDAIDATERGLMSTTGQSLIEGDIIVPLVVAATSKPFAYVEVTDDPPPAEPGSGPADGVDDLPPAEKILRFDFAEPKGAPTPYFDHTGLRLPAGSALYRAADGFFGRVSAAETGGRSWRLFLRAVTDDRAVLQEADRLPEVPVSGLAPVRLTLSIHEGATLRPLPYLEWPLTVLKAATVAQRDLRADANLLHVPVIGGRDGAIRFVPKPGRERAATVTWNATPARDPGTPETVPLAAIASYSVYETVLDGLINFDLEALEKRAKPLRRIVPIEPACAREHSATMADTQNWEAQYPVFARTRDHLENAGSNPEEMTERWPETYSWADSELDWPDALKDGERAALAADQALGRLLDLGEAYARTRVHPYLALLFARLHDLGDGSARRLQVEVALGPPPKAADPSKWLEADSALLDPYGWAGLITLGLAAPFALRDPVTGLLVDQGALLERLVRARAGLAALLDRPGATGDLLSGLEKLRNVAARHVMIELPIQHAQAYRARAEAAHAADVGLATVQVSLRPLPQQIVDYDVIAIDATSRKVEGTLTLERRTDILFAGVDRPAVGGEPGAALDATLFCGPNTTLLVREGKGNGESRKFRDLLRGLVPIKEAPDVGLLAKAPIAYLKRSLLWTDGALTPFGRFTPLPGKAEKDTLVPPGYSEARYGTWINHLAAAFARVDPDDPASFTRRQAIDALTAKLRADLGLFDSYRTWAARLFATAPIEGLFDGIQTSSDTDDGPALAMAAAQPKSTAPVRIAADGQGRLRLTRFLKEEWATARGYSVTCEGRYDRLVRAVVAKAAEPPPEADRDASVDSLPPGAARTDVFLPRVRALEAPAILSMRAIRAQDGRPFNEIVVAHSEMRLTESNREVAAKLEFGDIRRRYRRVFADPGYVASLKDASLLDGAELSRAVAVEGVWDAWPERPDLDAHDQTLLFAAPAARWGASRYQDAAEPFYYRQTVTVEATASHRLMTQGHEAVMPSGEPDALTPLGPDHSVGAPAKIDPLDWAAFWPPTGLEAFWDEGAGIARAARRAAWSDEIELPDAQKRDVIRLMRPSGYRVEARLPRYAESLSPDLRTGPFAHELFGYDAGGRRRAPAGLLPDAGVRIVVADLAPGETFVAIAQVSPLVPPSREESASAPSTPEDSAQPLWAKAFRFTTLSSDFETGNEQIVRAHGSNWTRGLFAQIDVRPTFAVVVVGSFDLPPFGEPKYLVEPTFDRLIGADEWPGSGALARLAPLAIRLVVSERDAASGAVTIGLASPLTAPRWAFRPSLDQAAADAPADEADLAVALRLLLDVERRRAAALVAWDALARPGSDVGLLERIECADFVQVLKHPGGPNENEQIGLLRRRGFEIHERVVRHGTASWRAVDGDIVSDDWKIVLVDRFGGDVPAEVVDRAIGDHAGDPERPPNALGRKRLGEALRRLAGIGHRPTAMRRPQIFAQRGNEPRAPWGEEVSS